ncbi:uncharacterized protein LOC124335809 [Daphnia pulicaria]|uniref:uncharacterized protein LOC124335809 n=1 Tax=Daphnia pulicaria TaxID=35523 RepID=UPI001EE9B7D1|nr:uncharacterized protein LOC124335809 [Daphnia pulicaria]
MNTLILVLSLLACALASPAPYVVSRSPAVQFSRSNTEILGQINQLNDDGTYTFGYESADGSFRVENRDIDGYVNGKYGYVDANGQVQEFEYVAGSTNGEAIGFQARGTAIPVTNTRAQGFPVLSSAVSVDQKFQDYEYSSVDDDRDGFPDNLFDGSFGTRNVVKPNIVRLTGGQTYNENTSPILRAVGNPSKVSVQPSVVRLATASQTPSSVVRVVNPGRNTQKSVVRLATPSNTVRFVNPAQVSNQQQQIVRLSNTAKSVMQPARLAGGGYQVVRQRQQQPQQQFVQVAAAGQSLLRSPSSYYTSNYGGQRFVSRSPVRSSGRLNPFFGGVATTTNSNVRDNFGSLMIRDNNKLTSTSSFAPSSVQTVFIDSDDFDDLNDFDDDFDDDDSFIVGSSAFLG